MTPARALVDSVWRRTPGRIGLLVLLAVVLAAVAGPFVLPSPVEQPDIEHGGRPPSLAHPLGTDS